MHPFKKAMIGLFGLLLILTSVSLSDQAEEKILTLEDYPLWQRITSPSLSPDGKWATFGYRPNDGDNTLYFKSLTSDAVHEIPGGSRPVFSENSRWAACRVEPLKPERKKLEKAKKPVVPSVELLDLESGDKWTVAGGEAYCFADPRPFLAVKKRRHDPKADFEGADFLLRSLADGSTLSLGNVGAFAFNKPGTHLAFILDTEGRAGNGVHLMDLGAGTLRALDTGAFDYSQLTWDEEGTALAVLRGREVEDHVRKSNALLTFTGIGKGEIGTRVYDPDRDESFPENMVISEFGPLSWNTETTMVFLGIKAQRKKEKTADKSDEKIADVDVWHWKDEEIQSVQMRRARRNRRMTFLSVVHREEGRFVRLADENMRSVTPAKNGRWALGRDDGPYRLRPDLSPGKADYFRVDTRSGKKELIEKMLERPLGSSPERRHLLYLQEEELYVYDLETARKTHLTTGEPGFFVNREDDHAYDHKPGYRPAGWTKDGRSVLMNHEFDLFLLALDGKSAQNITKELGRKNRIRFGWVRLDPDEEGIDLSRPLLLSAYGEWTKQSGFYSLEAGKAPKRLVFEDRRYGRPVKAKNADALLYTRETFVEFPDCFVSGGDFRTPRKITDANPQQAEYAWGRRILIDYESRRGTRLQATLTLPAGYRKGEKYPMLVYFYEKMSQRHHQYSMPVYDDRPHMSAYASDGYLVLMPDIVYADGTPGTAAVECLIPAVEKAIELGYADPKRIGLQGHSWGGYQSSFLVTQTDLFACVVTGAPLTNLVSMYNILYKSSGNTNQSALQFGQGRLDATPWTNLERYIAQSPVHQAEGIRVPFLILHGTEDGAVDWNQGLEFYASARRLGKQVILLSYPGEPHHLSRIENQKDFQIRMKQYFDHYLKGADAPEWMVNGIPFLEKKGGKKEGPGR